MRTVLSVVFMFVALSFFFGVAAVAVPYPDQAGGQARSTVSAKEGVIQPFLCFPGDAYIKGKGKLPIPECYGPCAQIVCANPPRCNRCRCEAIPGCTR